jgi:hypothetical protein
MQLLRINRKYKKHAKFPSIPNTGNFLLYAIQEISFQNVSNRKYIMHIVQVSFTSRFGLHVILLDTTLCDKVCQ